MIITTRGGTASVLDFGEDVEAADAGQADVEQHHVEGPAGKRRERGAGRPPASVMWWPASRRNVLMAWRNAAIVVDHENMAARGCSAPYEPPATATRL